MREMLLLRARKCVLLWHNSHIDLRGYFVDYKYGNVRRTCPKNGRGGKKIDVFEAIRTRRSIRKYKDEPVEKDKLLKIIEAARLAPSTLNRQPWSFVVVTDPEVKKKLRSACNQDWFAPAIIVECAFPEKAWVRDDGEKYWKLDVAIAVQNMVLAAWEEGLGICWIGAFREEEVKKILGIPEDGRVLVMTTLGYPAEKKGPVTNRKPLEEIVHYDHW